MAAGDRGMRRRARPGAARAAPAALPAASHRRKQALVSFGSATLNGTVNPKGADTSYYFQYGPTKSYGLQTGILDAGTGHARRAGGDRYRRLQPLSVYHFRLVAVNASGASIGADKSFSPRRCRCRSRSSHRPTRSCTAGR